MGYTPHERSDDITHIESGRSYSRPASVIKTKKTPSGFLEPTAESLKPIGVVAGKIARISASSQAELLTKLLAHPAWKGATVEPQEDGSQVLRHPTRKAWLRLLPDSK